MRSRVKEWKSGRYQPKWTVRIIWFEGQSDTSSSNPRRIHAPASLHQSLDGHCVQADGILIRWQDTDHNTAALPLSGPCATGARRKWANGNCWCMTMRS